MPSVKTLDLPCSRFTLNIQYYVDTYLNKKNIPRSPCIPLDTSSSSIELLDFLNVIIIEELAIDN